MRSSRLRQFEERKEKRRLILAILGSAGILLFLAFFGLKILVGFSLFLDKLQETAPKEQSQTIILPPVLDPLPVATNSATINVTGKGQVGLTLILYLNETESKKLTIADDGTFIVKNLAVSEGTITVSAKQKDDKDNISNLSNVITVQIKRTPPTLDVTAPADGATVIGEKNTVTVAGSVKDDTTNVTVNGRFVLVGNNGSFRYDYPLNEGSNTLTIVAIDAAGNQTQVQRRVTYQK